MLKLKEKTRGIATIAGSTRITDTNINTKTK
jgi:hypothetical protein